jgi:plasmid stabilization system protein ParE
MTFTVLWTREASKTFDERIAYLQQHFSEREISNFKIRVETYLNTLGEEPFIGKQTGKRKNVFIGLIIPPVSLVYRVKELNRTIELISFFDNRQNPKKLKKYTR